MDVQKEQGLRTGVEARCVLGGLGTGKTQAVVERAAQLVEGGANPGDLRVFAATPNGACVLRERLAARMGAGAAAQVRVCTPRAFELGLLAAPQARAFTGREPRLLLNYEVNVLMEDMKTSGLRAGRLKEMLKFFYRSWTELADDDPAWLYGEEEAQVHGLIKDCLAFNRGMLESELANFAVNYLRSNEEALAAVRTAHVLVDDYQALCRASQVLACMLAGETLTVTGDVRACAETFEPYPYPAGLDELVALDGVAVQRLDASRCTQAVVGAANALCAHVDAALAESHAERCAERLAERARLENLTIEQTRAMLEAQGEDVEPPLPGCAADVAPRAAADAPAGAVESLVCADPEAEAAAVAGRIEAALAAGAAPERVYVAVPNRAWAAAVGKAVAERGIAVATPFDARSLNGDVRDLGRCEAARVLALVQLAAEPQSSIAWRTWCGFGDWLANSPGFAALRAVGLAAGADLYATLSSLSDAAERMGGASPADVVPGEALGADERASIERVVAAYRAGREMLAQLDGYAGAELAERAARLALGREDAPVPAVLRRLCKGTEAPALDAAGCIGRVYGLAAGEDGFGQAACAVRMGSLEQAFGLEYDLLVVCGFVNGFTPRHAYFDQVSTSPARQRQTRVAEARRLYGALCGCADAAVFTSFTQIDALQAERLDLKVDRIRMKRGQRVASVSPSVMLEALGLAAE